MLNPKYKTAKKLLAISLCATLSIATPMIVMATETEEFNAETDYELQNGEADYQEVNYEGEQGPEEFPEYESTENIYENAPEDTPPDIYESAYNQTDEYDNYDEYNEYDTTNDSAYTESGFYDENGNYVDPNMTDPNAETSMEMELSDEDAKKLGILAAIGGTVFLIIAIICGIISIISIIAMWKLFEKADEAGWKSIIPILNVYVLTKISTGKPILMLLSFVPFVNFIFIIYLYYKLNQAFSGGTASFILLLLFPYIILPIMAFSEDAEYIGYDAE